MTERVLTHKQRLGSAEALALARKAAHVWVARGKKVVHLDMTEKPPGDDELKKLLLGRSGTLRAPTIVSGDRLLVGFNSDLYSQAFGGS